MVDDDLMDAAVPVLSLTDKAVTKVLDIRGAEPDPESLALWIEINGTNGDAYRYDMYFQAAADAGADDWTRDQSGLMTVVPARSVGMIVGSVLDVDGDEPDDGMSIRNPNHPPSGPASPTIAGSVDLSGDLAQRVSQVLDQQVNPSIAAHGGRADLVAVEEKDGVAYLRLSGGCAGCGMAAVTLGQGIEVAIKDSVPEIIRIVDVTDHAAGTNPYYEPAKK